MCLGTFSRRGAVASATIYPCAECASSRSVFIVWKRSFLYDKKDARISPDTSQLVFLPYLRLPVNARNQLLCIIGHSSFIVLKFCLSYSVCLSCMQMIEYDYHTLHSLEHSLPILIITHFQLSEFLCELHHIF